MSSFEPYITLSDECIVEGEYSEKRSRFIAHLAHVTSEADARSFIDEMKRTYYDARHNVSAWILADGTARSSDDGEPSKTAGKPALDVLQGMGCANICVVITRYFGGTLLGAGGLVRAYTIATQRALDEAMCLEKLVRVEARQAVKLVLPYALYDQIAHRIAQCGGTIISTDFLADVEVDCAFTHEAADAFIDSIQDLLAMRGTCEKAGIVYASSLYCKQNL